MTCPHCGAPAQPDDLFCMRCGHALTPTDPTRHLGSPAAPAYPDYDANPVAEPAPYTEPATPYRTPAQPQYGAPADSPYQPQQAPYAPPSYGAPAGAPRRLDPSSTDQRWASGSSFPQPNPYAGTPNTVSPGTMVNGRPIGGSNGGGLLKGLGAGVAALFVVLAKAGGALAGLGVFFLKFWFWIWAFNLLFHGGLAVLILLLIILALAGSVWRSRTV